MKKDIPHLIIFGLVIIVLLLAPYLIRIFGAVASVSYSLNIPCSVTPVQDEPKPSTIQTANEGQLFSIDFYFNDTDSATADPNWFTITTQPAGTNRTKATLTFTPNSGQVGVHTVIVTAWKGGCNAAVSFNLTVVALPSAPGGGGGGRACTVTIVCGDCIDNRKQCQATDSCTGTTLVYQNCVSPSAELEELPEEVPEEKLPVIKEKPAPVIIYPAGLEGIFNKQIIEYPSPGIIQALRQKLFIAPGKIDLSLYNLYYEPQETALGLWLKGTHPAVPVLFLVLLVAGFFVSLLLIGLKKATVEIEEMPPMMPPPQQQF